VRKKGPPNKAPLQQKEPQRETQNQGTHNGHSHQQIEPKKRGPKRESLKALQDGENPDLGQIPRRWTNLLKRVKKGFKDPQRAQLPLRTLWKETGKGNLKKKIDYYPSSRS